MFKRPFYKVIIISIVALALIAATQTVKQKTIPGSMAPYNAASAGFYDDFSSPDLDPAWTVIPGARYLNTGYGLPVNDYSLTNNPGHLRYSLNPMSHQHGFLNGYQAAPPPEMNAYYGYDPGLEIYRPISGDHWLLETKVTYYLPCANGRLLNLFVYFGPGGTGTTAAGWGRGRDTDCSSWGQNSLFAQIVSQPGTTAGDLQYESATESLPIGDPDLSTYYLRLERAGGLLTWSRSTDNVNWTMLFSRDFGTALDGLAQRVTIVGHSWFVPAGSYADYDYISLTSNVMYSFDGFFAPVDNLPTMNIAKAGQTVPLKWRITDASGVPVTNLTSMTVIAVSLACDPGTTTDQMEEYASGASGLQNLGDGYYQFNWKTPKSYANSCKTLRVDLGEGLVHELLFRFTK